MKLTTGKVWHIFVGQAEWYQPFEQAHLTFASVGCENDSKLQKSQQQQNYILG